MEQSFREQGKRGPAIAELGGKNPVIVSDAAALDDTSRASRWARSRSAAGSTLPRRACTSTKTSTTSSPTS
nr:hypothetical protein [Halorussus marinus]